MRYNIYVHNKLLPFFKSYQEIALKLNVSVTEVLLNKEYQSMKKVRELQKKQQLFFEKIRIKQEFSELIELSCLFENMIKRVKMLKDKVAPYSALIDYIKKQLRYVELFTVNDELKNTVREMIQKYLLGLIRNKDNYKNHIEIFLMKLEEFKQKIIIVDFKPQRRNFIDDT